MTTALDFHLLKVGHCSHPECVAQRGGSLKPIRFPALVALLVHPQRGPMLFDTGYSDAFLRATDPFPERFYRWVTPMSLPDDETLPQQLARFGYAPADIAHLFISHLHADHISGLDAYPHAQLHAMRAEIESMRGRSRIGALRRGFLRALLPNGFGERMRFAEDAPRVSLAASMQPFDTGFDLLGDGSVTGVPLPGHTAGQMGALFRTTSGRDVFLVADACWSIDAIRLDRPPMWIAERIFDDRRKYHETFDGLRHLHATHRDLLIVPSHCEATWQQIVEDARDEAR